MTIVGVDARIKHEIRAPFYSTSRPTREVSARVGRLGYRAGRTVGRRPR